MEERRSHEKGGGGQGRREGRAKPRAAHLPLSHAPTPPYVACAIHRSPSADVFSFGITLLEVTSAQALPGQALPGHGPPWEALRDGVTALPIAAATHPTLAAIITGMMAAAPEHRPTAAAVVVACPAPSSEAGSTRWASLSKVFGRRTSTKVVQVAAKVVGRLGELTNVTSPRSPAASKH